MKGKKHYITRNMHISKLKRVFTWLSKPDCHGDFNVDIHITTKCC